jgi:hypothetical protein
MLWITIERLAGPHDHIVVPALMFRTIFGVEEQRALPVDRRGPLRNPSEPTGNQADSGRFHDEPVAEIVQCGEPENRTYRSRTLKLPGAKNCR